MILNVTQHNRPWGYYLDIYRSDYLVMKQLVIFPGQRISLQYHNKRKEYWSVASGNGKLTMGDVESFIFPSNMIYIPVFKKHRVENIDTVNLVIYETQIGICLEDDIVRIEDDYQR